MKYPTRVVERFVIAVRRDQRARVPRDWIDTIRQTDGVAVHGRPTGQYVLVDASPEGLAKIRRALDPFVLIEKEIIHTIS